MHVRTPVFWMTLLTLTFGTTALAQATRTWVSGVGDDANPCSRTAPCKTLAGAYSRTAAAGEIDILDPGGFGTLTISKAVTIDAHGSFGSVLASGIFGFIISAGPTDVITLRGLSVNGAGTGLDGIKFNGGGALHVEDCSITGFTHAGINFAPTAPANLFIKNTQFSENAQGAVLVSGPSQATVSKSELTNSPGFGLDATGTAVVSVHDSVFAGNAGVAVHSEVGTQVNLERSVVANNGTGIQGDGVVRLSEVMISDNVTGITGNVASFGNNRVAAGNATNGSPTATLPQQ